MKHAPSKELIDAIKSHEGLSQFIYQDTLGYSTIGIGRCVDKRKGKGLSKEEQIYLLMNDISECMDYLDDYAFYQCLDGVRQGVLIEMCFNLGLNGLLGFRNMIAAINKKDYASATIEMRGSRWASQIGSSRLENLCFRMRNGDYP